MNVLYISALDLWSINKGVGGSALYNVLKGYADSGHTVYFITGNKHDKSLEEEFGGKLKIIRFSFPVLEKIRKYKKIGFLADLIWWTLFQLKSYSIGKKVIMQSGIDVIYGYEVYGVPVSKRLSRKFNKPFVARYQGTILGEHWIGRPFWKLRAFKYYIAYNTEPDLIIMTNDGTEGDKILKRMGTNMEKVCFWMNGVDKSVRSPKYKNYIQRKLGIPNEATIFITSSRFAYWKRIDRAIRAMHSIKDIEDAFLIIIGSGDKGDYYQELVEELGLQEKVLFLGVVPNKDVRKHMNSSDVYLGTFDFSNASNGLFEAMLCGNAVIAFDYGSTSDFLDNGKAGVLVKDENDFNAAVRSLATDREKLNELKKLALDYATRAFWTWDERVAAEIEKVEGLVNAK